VHDRLSPRRARARRQCLLQDHASDEAYEEVGMINAVWTVGHHPSLCGTEKFGHLLAKKLGVPVLERHQVRPGDYPLVSVRASELQQWGDHPPPSDLLPPDS